MEISWKWLILYIGLVLLRFCTGFPINLEDSNTGHAQFLTGIAAILITVGSIVLAGCLCCQRKKGFEEFHNSPVVASAAPTVDHGYVNPIANGEFTIFTPLSPPHSNNSVFLANEQVISRTSDDYVYGDIDVSQWFTSKNTDFPRIKLKYIKELGNGSFGKVVQGAAQDLDGTRTWSPVVVRILDAASSARQRILFLHDALFYLAPPHPNLLELKGCCLNTAPLLLLQESCAGQDLKSRLRTVGYEDRILQWCCQLTSALRHLHDHGFIHPDLAARNCLLSDFLTLKLGDYSLSPSKYPADYYKGGEPLIPVRWRAPESLDCTPTTIQPKKLNKEANIWSLGVVMWEICENGAQPYGFLDDDEVISRVFGSEGLRLDGPSNPQLYSDYIFRLIKMCWNNSEFRPKVAQIDMMLSDLLQVHKHTQDPLLNIQTVLNGNSDFDKRWESFKPNTIVKTDNHAISIEIESDGGENIISKPMSPSLNNLHGSLDNISSVPQVRSLSEAPKTTETVVDVHSSELDKHLNFKLGPSQLPLNEAFPDSPGQSDSLTDSMIFKQPGSSESDTEEENWRRKVERGAYTEKVRLKSRSVADLMVLTHVDYSESESETPMPSMDYKANRSFRKSNLENSSLNFSSEGNLLNLEDTFEKELKKLQVERRDSLLFVPDNKCQNNSNLSLLHELNSPTEIKPMNQIYNIFNMTIDKFGTLGVSGSKLNDIINIGDDTRVFSRQDSENKSDLGYATLHNSERNSDFGSVDGEHLLEDRNAIIKTEIEERLKNCQLLIKNEDGQCRLQRNEDKKIHIDTPEENSVTIHQKNTKLFKQNLPDILASLDQEHTHVNVDLLESNLLQTKNEDNMQKSIAIYDDRIASNETSAPEVIYSKNTVCSMESPVTCKLYTESQEEIPTNVENPKLDLNSHKLTVSDDSHSDIEIVINKELVSNESQIVPDLCSEKIESSDSINAFVSLDQDANNENVCEPNEQDTLSNDSIENEFESATSLAEGKIYTESLLPEIKQEFVIGPSILQTTHFPESPCDVPSNDSGKSLLNEVETEPDMNSNIDTLNLFLNAEREYALQNTWEVHAVNMRACVKETSFPIFETLQGSSECIEKLELKENGDPTLLNKKSDKLTVKINPKGIIPETTQIILDSSVETNLGKTFEKVFNEPKPTVAFDLSEGQEQTMPNSLTHTSVFTSTPFGKKKDVSLPSENVFSSLNLFGANKENNDENDFSSNFSPTEPTHFDNENKLNYSLETWDNFLGKSFDSSRESNDNFFDSFTSEPRSMLFLDESGQNDKGDSEIGEQVDCQKTSTNETFVKNGTFVTEGKGDGTFVMDNKDGTFVIDEKKDGTFVKESAEEKDDEKTASGHWESGGGWFLHPQSNIETLSGDIEPQPSTSKDKGSYIGFGMDDEIMTAIRNELLEKLPHAQGASQKNISEEEKWNQVEKNEVFLKYNVYNTPLSPIPEESSFDENDDDLVITDENTPKLNDTDSDWSEQGELEYPAALSSRTNDSPLRIPNHGHTPSQSSCCSNDTLFNCDDFASPNEKDREQFDLNDDVFEKEIEEITFKNSEKGESETHSCTETFKYEENAKSCETTQLNNSNSSSSSTSSDNVITSPNVQALENFLTNERNASSMSNLLQFSAKVVAPLPSPEDKPWKSLPASLLTYDTITNPTLTIDTASSSETESSKGSNVSRQSNNEIVLESQENSKELASDRLVEIPEAIHLEHVAASNKTFEHSTKDSTYGNIPFYVNENLLKKSSTEMKTETNSPMYETIENNETIAYENLPKVSDAFDDTLTNIYEHDINNEADYVNIKKLDDTECSEYINALDQRIIDENHCDDPDMLGVLTDIRFSGPIDNQLMSTSFSESNDVDEQDWDSGSDTRSSSSGEFIWKEGEHEESLKALRAAPHDVLDDVKPMEEITEETTESDVSSATSDEEGENLEFVPSAWDKFATPTKSALRSPEKSLDRSESKKSKGVWFKKQKYHCVYEYPREPESPVLHSQDLWKPQIDYAAFSDWEIDAETYLPPPTAESDINPSTFTFKPKINNSRRSLYYLTSPNDIQGDGTSPSNNPDEDFIIPSSCRSLSSNSSLCSQFFPGASSWIENVTPDSGLDDSTPGSISDSGEITENYLLYRQVLPLKKLAALVVNKIKEPSKGTKDALGGLRHTRNRLKLDLPPSPSAFTSSKTFTVEPLQEPVVIREKPTFSTFGKSRFLVQQVDTPTDDNSQRKNVCFDVIPYKPINIIPLNSYLGEQNKVTYELLKKDFDDTCGFNDKKETFSKGEASLLDSADEDSGIESSTLERKMSNVIQTENILD